MKKLLATLALGIVMTQAANAADTATQKAIFAGGCFWCMEPAFDNTEGVTNTIAGYLGGAVKNPTYEQVSSGKSGHVEAIEVTYDPKRVSYEKLLEVYWRNIDPFDAGGQFADRGPQYATVVFYATPEEKAAAETSKVELEKTKGKKVATRIEAVSEFYPAEDYHQNYYQTNSTRYNAYKYGSGRVSKLDELWNKR